MNNMVFVIHNEQHKICDFSKTQPTEQYWFEINKEEASELIRILGIDYGLKRYCSCLLYDPPKKRLSDVITFGEERYVELSKGMIGLIIRATQNFDEAKQDLEHIVKARKLEDKYFSLKF